MTRELLTSLSGEVLDDEVELTLNELCHICQLSLEQAYELIDQGLVEPRGASPRQWRFQSVCIQRIRSAQRLQRDLGVNSAGAVLALELMDEIQELRTLVLRLQR